MKKQNFTEFYKWKYEFYKWKYENLYKIYWIVSVILALSLIITIFTYEAYINNLKENEKTQCSIIQAQHELINKLYPKWAKESCDELQEIGILDNGTKDYLCKTFLEIKLPDKIEC